MDKRALAHQLVDEMFDSNEEDVVVVEETIDYDPIYDVDDLMVVTEHVPVAYRVELRVDLTEEANGQKEDTQG